MAPTTRSRTQTTGTGSESKTNKPSVKRKNSGASTEVTVDPKKSKTVNKADSRDKKPSKKPPQHDEKKHGSGDEESESMHGASGKGGTATAAEKIMINRAPVLELWSASIASLLHPDLAWDTCLSVGSAISSLAAISKGRSIGAIDKPDPSAQAEKHDKRTSTQGDLDEVHVMSFTVKLKDGLALVGDKPKKGNEETLSKKYGDDYDKVKKAMQEVLQHWKGKEDEINGKAFHMYEDFRPSVAAGQKGWGRKGELSLDTLRSSAAVAQR